MSIKLWSVKTIKLEDVKPLPKNGRFIANKNLSGLKKSLKKFGVVELPVFNSETKHLIAGHQRVEVLKESGVLEVPMIVVSLSAEDELAASLTVNNPNIMGEFTPAVVDLLDGLEANSNELFKDLNMDMLRVSLKEFAPKIPPNPEKGSTDFAIPPEVTNDSDLTTCPCCKNKWNLAAGNVEVIEV